MIVKKRKLAQHRSPRNRYFNKGIEAENDATEVDGTVASNDSDEDNSEDESNDVGVELQEEDDDDSNSESDVDEVENDSKEELEGSHSDTDDDEASDSEGETEHDSSKKVKLSKKQKTLIKQHNDSLGTKKAMTHKLQKFQGTHKASEENEELGKNDSPVRKRKKGNEVSFESEDSPAKKPHTLDNETASTLDKRREERDARSLFLKDLPPNTTAEMVKNLSPEIITVRIPLESKKNLQSLYAFIEFENEDAAERNYRKLTEKQIGNKNFTVDFCGEKSKFKKTAKEYPVNPTRLFIPNVPLGISPDELKQQFPEAVSFTTKIKGTKRLVFASFETENEAKKAFEENANLVIRGKKLTVLYAFKKKPGGSKKRSRRRPQIIKSEFEDEENDVGTVEVQKEESKGKLETNTKMKKTKKNISKKHKSSMETDKNSQEDKPIVETAKTKGKRRKTRKKQ